MARSASDTFETGTRAAAWGGTTTIVDFAVQRTGERVQDGLAAWHGKAEGQCAIDYGFHQIIGGVDDDSLKAMDELVAEGITSFKLFMAYPGVFYSDDGQILRAMQTAADNGSLMMMHAENGIAIDVLVAQALARGDTDPKFHGTTRPWETEEEATHRAIMLAKLAGAPLYIVHMSAHQAVAAVARGARRGLERLRRDVPAVPLPLAGGALGRARLRRCEVRVLHAAAVAEEGHQDALWRYLRTDDLSVVSTDHCPFCMKEQKELGLGNFSAIPNGIGGVEHRMDLIYQGVVDGQLSLAALGRTVLHDAGAHVRAVSAEGRDRPGFGCRRRRLRPERHDAPQRRHPPHEHGLLGVRGHGRAGQGRHRALAGPGDHPGRSSTSAARATADTCRAVNVSTWSRAEHWRPGHMKTLHHVIEGRKSEPVL